MRSGSDPRDSGARDPRDNRTGTRQRHGSARQGGQPGTPTDRRRADGRSGTPRSAPGPASPQTARSPRAPRPATPTVNPRPANNQRPRAAAPKNQASVRGRRVRRNRAALGNPRLRGRIALIVLLSMLALAGGKLVVIQAIDPSGYAAKSEAQRTRDITLLAQRGSITDRNGTALAFTVEGRAIAARPALFTDDNQRRQVANILVADAGADLTADEIMTKLTSGKTYVYLARNLMPAQADAIMAKISALFDIDHRDAVVTERQDIRQYPDGSASAALVGGTDYDGNGLSGVEAKFDTKLAGKDGDRVVDVDARHLIIPGSARDEKPAVDGMDVSLTIDSDLQYTTLKMLTQAVDSSRALSGCVVIMQVADAQVPATACYQPGESPKQTGNRAVTDAFEPGSVNKVVTFAAALEAGLITPTTVFNVDGSIPIGDVTVSDAWGHGPIDMTATGILAKSSNVGTLHIAQAVGEDAFVAMAKKFGQGVKTGIQLPAETSGLFPDPSTWSVSTFGNLPIGQGVSYNLVELASMYQAIANGGLRIAPTIVASTTMDGTTTPTPVGATTQVMSPTNARTLLDMLRGTMQGGDTNHRGTAPAAAINGYQVAGKTGTAQKVDPDTNEYSQSAITSTFAGVFPADNPKYVVAIMLDDPKGDSPAGTTSCAPLFHNIAAYLARAADVPPSATEAPIYDLYVS
jgi:cell division protein FtsI (penicillin-binding protein 3)